MCAQAPWRGGLRPRRLTNASLTIPTNPPPTCPRHQQGHVHRVPLHGQAAGDGARPQDRSLWGVIWTLQRDGLVGPVVGGWMGWLAGRERKEVWRFYRQSGGNVSTPNNKFTSLGGKYITKSILSSTHQIGFQGLQCAWKALIFTFEASEAEPCFLGVALGVRKSLALLSQTCVHVTSHKL